jgi:hypothetical protein
MLRITDLIERVDQGVLSVRLERNVKVDGCTGWRMTVVLPLGRNSAPRMLHPHGVPARRHDGCRKGDRNSGQEGQHREPTHGRQGTRSAGRDREKRGDDGGKRRIQKARDFMARLRFEAVILEDVIGDITRTAASLSI